MAMFREQLRQAGQRIAPVQQSPREVMARVMDARALPEPTLIAERVNTRLFLTQPEIHQINTALDVQGHMEELRDYMNNHTRDKQEKWEVVNAHGVATEYGNDGKEIFHWYDGVMLTREVGREDTSMRRRTGREYFFVGRFSNQEPEGQARKLGIPGDPEPRLFADASPTELVITSGISWVKGGGPHEPIIIGRDLTPATSNFHVIQLPEQVTQNEPQSIEAAKQLFEAELAEQAAKQIYDFPRR